MLFGLFGTRYLSTWLGRVGREGCARSSIRLARSSLGFPPTQPRPRAPLPPHPSRFRHLHISSPTQTRSTGFASSPTVTSRSPTMTLGPLATPKQWPTPWSPLAEAPSACSARHRRATTCSTDGRCATPSSWAPRGHDLQCFSALGADGDRSRHGCRASERWADDRASGCGEVSKHDSPSRLAAPARAPSHPRPTSPSANRASPSANGTSPSANRESPSADLRACFSSSGSSTRAP